MTSNCFSNSRRFSCTFQHENLPIKSTVSALIFRYFSNIYRAGPDAVVPKNFLKMLWQQVGLPLEVRIPRLAAVAAGAELRFL